MLHLLYLVAFTTIAFLAIANLMRSLLSVSFDVQRRQSTVGKSQRGMSSSRMGVVHPEMLDERGNQINEPLLVMRSLTVEDAREQLDALYESSPGRSAEKPEES
ncbi:MAG: DUF2973 domain-containing protein [Coleofasciculaceae cyanobacterium]